MGFMVVAIRISNPAWRNWLLEEQSDITVKEVKEGLYHLGVRTEDLARYYDKWSIDTVPSRVMKRLVYMAQMHSIIPRGEIVQFDADFGKLIEVDTSFVSYREIRSTSNARAN